MSIVQKSVKEVREALQKGEERNEPYRQLTVHLGGRIEAIESHLERNQVANFRASHPHVFTRYQHRRILRAAAIAPPNQVNVVPPIVAQEGQILFDATCKVCENGIANIVLLGSGRLRKCGHMVCWPCAERICKKRLFSGCCPFCLVRIVRCQY